LAVPNETLWLEANQAYEAGDYATAVRNYEALLAQGVQHGALHYNLGNAYFRGDRLGKALLHFYKAKKYLPGDKDVLNNLAVANKHRVDPQIENEDEAFGQSFDRLLRGFSYRKLFYLALTALILGGLASLGLILRPMS